MAFRSRLMRPVRLLSRQLWLMLTMGLVVSTSVTAANCDGVLDANEYVYSLRKSYSCDNTTPDKSTIKNVTTGATLFDGNANGVPGFPFMINGQPYVVGPHVGTGEGSCLRGNVVYDRYELCLQNNAPTAGNVSLNLQEGGTGSVALAVSDADAGDTHSLSIVSAPSVGSAYISGGRAYYTPPTNWNGTVTFTYRAVDSAGAASNTATVTVRVTAVNDVPTVANASFTTAEDTVGKFTLAVTDIDLSYEGDSHVWEIVSAPSADAGVASISGKTLTFTPEPDWNGVVTLTYRARDEAGAYSNTATITITVTPVNDVPVADAKSMTMLEDTPGTVTLTASDIDSPAPSTFQVVTAPNAAHGTASISGSTLSFTPAANWNGSTSLTYRAQDSAGGWSAPVTVSITVTPVNDVPSVVNRTLTTDEDTPATLTLTVTDVDLSFEGDSHVWSIVTAPNASHGTATLTGTTLRFTPAPDWNGTTSLTYRVRDAAGANSNVGTITITVVPVNDAPVAIAKTLTTDEDTVGTVILSATDIDSPVPTVFEIVAAPAAAAGVAQVTGNTLTFTPVANWNGTASLTYRAQDSSGDWSTPVTVTIKVTSVNDVPEALSPGISMKTQESRPVTITTGVRK
ncbi:tandem-95 repeat protein [Pseudomonas aeruginosa]